MTLMIFRMLLSIEKLFRKNIFIFLIPSILFVIILLYLASQIKFDNSVWLKDDNIHKKSKDKLYKVFDKGEELIISIDFESSFFNPKWIQLITNITNEIEKEEGVVEVKSPLTATTIIKHKQLMHIISYKKAMDDGIIQDLKEYKDRLIKSSYYGKLISKDFQKIALVVKIKAPIKENNFERRSSIMKASKRILLKYMGDNLEGKKPYNKNVYFTGEVALSQILVAYTQRDLIILLPLSVILILFFLFVIYRKVSEVLIILYISLIAIVLSISVFYILGFTMNAISISLPILILDISYGLSIYIFNRWHETHGSIEDEREAVNTTIKEIWKPSLFTILAAAIGFGSFYFSNLIPLSQYSLVSMIVILLCFPLVLLHLWYFLSFAKAYKLERYQKERFLWIKRLYINSYYKFTLPFRYVLLIFSIVILCLTFYSFSFIRTETNFIDAFFKKDNQVRKDFDFVDTYLGGTGAVDIIISTGNKDFFKKKESLEHLQNLEKTLSSNNLVNYIQSYLTPLKMMHKEFSTSNKKNKQELPQNDKELAQEVLFMEFSRGDSKSDVLSSYVNFDYTDSRIHLQTPNLNSERADTLKKFINDNIKNDSNFTYALTGASMYFQALSEYVNETQVESIVISLVIAVIFFIVQFGFKLGMLGLLPNIIPILMTVSLIVMLGIPFDFATVIIFSVSFSMCVDDTLQFLHFYKKQKLIEPDVDKRIVNMLSTLGTPAFFTSSLFVLGISVFAISDLMLLLKFGIFTLNSLIFDYLSNIFILPAFIKIFDKK